MHVQLSITDAVLLDTRRGDNSYDSETLILTNLVIFIVHCLQNIPRKNRNLQPPPSPFRHVRENPRARATRHTSTSAAPRQLPEVARFRSAEIEMPAARAPATCPPADIIRAPPAGSTRNKQSISTNLARKSCPRAYLYTRAPIIKGRARSANNARKPVFLANLSSSILLLCRPRLLAPESRIWPRARGPRYARQTRGSTLPS